MVVRRGLEERVTTWRSPLWLVWVGARVEERLDDIEVAPLRGV
jgi:hypothetical protein